jgi:hypothetical protein
MADGEPKYVALLRQRELYEVALFDADLKQVGHGFKGPNFKRADADLKYWVRTKGLEPLDRDDPAKDK